MLDLECSSWHWFNIIFFLTDLSFFLLCVGAVELENLPLKTDALKELELPFEVKAGLYFASVCRTNINKQEVLHNLGEPLPLSQKLVWLR